MRLPLVVSFLVLAASPAVAGVVALHQGDTDPLLQGWVVEPTDPDPPLAGVSVGPATDPSPWSSLVSAWAIYDDSTGSGSRRRYEVAPTPTDIAAGQTLGWTLSALLRVVTAPDPADFSVSLEYADGSRRFTASLGSDADENLLVVLGSGPPVPIPAAFTSTAGTSYHDIALAFDPAAGASGAADLYVDGERVVSGYQGFAGALTRINFGSGQSSSTGRGHYAEVRFATGIQECRDGLDNDGDGQVDGADGGCEAGTDPSERDPRDPCDDGADDDGDTLVDGADPECAETGGASERAVLPLAWNWNGMLHHGEIGAPSANGYRSISDRGIDLRASPAAGLAPVAVTGPSGLVYELAPDTQAPDLVHLGNRNTVDNGSKPLASVPDWLPDPDQTGPQTSAFEPLLLGPDDAIGILYHASNGGGRFAVTLGFASGDPVEVIVDATDWFAPSNPMPEAPTAGVAHQTTAGVMPGLGGIDNPVSDASLVLNEAVISVAELLQDGVADVAGRELVSLTFSDRFNPNSGYAVYAAAYGAGTSPSVPQAHLLVPVKLTHDRVLGSSPAEALRDEIQLVDESGLELVNGTLLVTTAQPNLNNWNTLTSVAAVTFDLGFEQDIDFIQIWNFNDSFGNNDFGATSIDLQVSSVGTNAGDADFSASPVLATLPIAEATGSLMYAGEGYRFNGHASPAMVPPVLMGVQHDFSAIGLHGRFVRLSDIDGSLSFGGRAGLSEVRFHRFVPEPGVSAGLCAGVVLLAALGRRRPRSAPRP